MGMKVRINVQGLKLYHVPRHKGAPYDPHGLSGEVVELTDGEHLSANRPVLVKVSLPLEETDKKPKNFTAHFAPEELCVCMNPAGSPAADDDRWQINLLYDGDCPSCMKQVEFLRKRMDENPEYAGLVRLTDLTAPDYDPQLCGGVEFEDGMRHIHAVTRNGEVFTGMQVFRQIYSTVGMEWVHTVTTLPFVGGLCDWLYDLWAEYRLQITGREDALEKVRMRRQRIQELSATECDVECEINWDAA